VDFVGPGSSVFLPAPVSTRDYREGCSVKILWLKHFRASPARVAHILAKRYVRNPMKTGTDAAVIPLLNLAAALLMLKAGSIASGLAGHRLVPRLESSGV